MMEIKIKPGARKDLARPKADPVKIRSKFMEFLRL
jgi:hypothetical protein